MLMYTEIFGERSFLKQCKSLKDLNLEFTHEAVSLTAFSNPIPLLFHDLKQGLAADDGSAFSKFPNLKFWSSYMEIITKTINTVQSGLEQVVKTLIQTSDLAHGVYLLSISNTAVNVKAFFEFINTSVEEFQNIGLTDKCAYALATCLGGAYFWKCHCHAPTRLSASFKTSDRNQLASLIWYGVCQTQDVMKEFETTKYRNHSVIYGKYI